MTVWKPTGRKTYRYRFYLHGQRHEGNTRQITEADAREWEDQEQRRLRREGAGLEVAPEHAPRFAEFAPVYLTHIKKRGKVRRIDRVGELLRVVLRFWGARPAKGAIDGEPYHDLRLVDPIRDPSWIVKFETWMSQRVTRTGRRPLSNQTKNHYRSILSRLYRVAKLPQYAICTGIRTNPFAELERDPTRGRRVTVTPAELRRWLALTPPHAQLAIAIAALAPKLRLDNVLSLEWDRHLDRDLRYITVAEHKTMDHTDAPLVVPISTPLRAVLRAAQRERRGKYVVMYRGDRVESIRHAVRTGAEAAGLTYGRDVGGVTFHTIRHTAATLLAAMPSLTEALRASTMGQDVTTTQKYTHLRPVHERPVLNRLGRTLKLDQILKDAFGSAASEAAVPRRKQVGKPQQKRDVHKRARRA